MDFQNRFTSGNIREVYCDLAIESAGPGQRLIEYVWTVRRSDDYNGCRLIESIHFDEQLVECLVLIGGGGVAAASTLTSERINLVDEDNAGREFSSLCKQVSHACSAESGEFFLEARTRGCEKRNARFFRRRSREQSLSCSWRTVKQDAAWNTTTETAEPLGISQKLNRLS